MSLLEAAVSIFKEVGAALKKASLSLEKVYGVLAKNTIVARQDPRWIASALVSVWFATISFLFLMLSSSNPIYSGVRWVDSAVFGYVSYVMNHGGIPYRDVFDHKGPLLYLLNYLGDRFFGFDGVWYVELVFIFGFLLVAYKICRLKCNIPLSILIASLTLLPLERYYDGGNASEEYAMLFIAIGVYLFIQQLYFNKAGKWSTILNGACFGAVFFLRVNMVAVWLAFFLSLLFKDWHHPRKIVQFAEVFLNGFLAVALPICIWLLVEGAFGDFIKDYWIFNFTYVANTKGVWQRLLVLKPYRRQLLVPFSIVCLLFQLGWGKNRYQTLAYISFVVATLLTISAPGRAYSHYGMILVPLLPFPIAVFLGNFNKKLTIFQTTFCFVAIIAMATNLNGLYINAKNNIQYAIQGKSTSLSEGIRKAASFIKKYTLPSDRILVIGNNPYLYLLADRLAISKYAYQYPLTIDMSLQKEFASELRKSEPKIIVIANTNNLDIGKFINLGHYVPILNYKDGKEKAVLYLKKELPDSANFH